MEQATAFPNNKLGKHNYLLRDEGLSRHLPDTVAESKLNLQLYLNKFKTVYVKPNNGTGGRGVIRVKARKDGHFSYQLGQQEHRFPDFEQLYRSLGKQIMNKKHLVQKAIPLLRVDDRPFDIRVMVQKDVEDEWVCTGIIARLAHPKKVVTNYHRGGTPLPLETLLVKHMPAKDVAGYVQSLRHFGLAISEHLGEGFPWVTAMGIDIGLDTELTPWIIEVNTKPDPHIFNQLKDKSSYKQIMKYIKYHRTGKKTLVGSGGR
jgi:glutathione synthase/RimK-type ligase-like ATP-grasp enzyme